VREKSLHEFKKYERLRFGSHSMATTQTTPFTISKKVLGQKGAFRRKKKNTMMHALQNSKWHVLDEATSNGANLSPCIALVVIESCLSKVISK